MKGAVAYIILAITTGLIVAMLRTCAGDAVEAVRNLWPQDLTLLSAGLVALNKHGWILFILPCLFSVLAVLSRRLPAITNPIFVAFITSAAFAILTLAALLPATPLYSHGLYLGK